MEKEILKKYCNDGLSSREIAKKESVSQTTIRYWLKKFNLTTRGWDRFDPIELRKIVSESKSRNEVLGKLGRNNSSAGYKLLKRAVLKYGIDVTHFRNRSENATYAHANKETLNDEIFVENGVVGRGTLRKRILRDNLIEYKCFKCKQDNNWYGEELVLVLDHANGINNDNRLKNLRFVCPNCNSQLPTHCKKNKHL